MLVYISNEHENHILEPIKISSIPSWIQDREAVMQKNLDFKNNFMEVVNNQELIISKMSLLFHL